MSFGLGRIHRPDPRDAAFPMAAALVAVPLPAKRWWWDLGWFGDQGATSQCVAFSWLHWLADGPVTHPGTRPLFPPGDVYREAQGLDEWPGGSPEYEGTSVRAGAKALQARGVIGSYLWSSDVDTVARAVLGAGPVVVGTNWYESMFRPVGGRRLEVSGPVVGGHAYLLNGYNTTTGLFRVKNSWGRGWATDGRAYLHRGDLARLLAENGEACLAVEVRGRA